MLLDVMTSVNSEMEQQLIDTHLLKSYRLELFKFQLVNSHQLSLKQMVPFILSVQILMDDSEMGQQLIETHPLKL